MNSRASIAGNTILLYCLLATVTILLPIAPVMAITASPNAVEVNQPDGTPLSLRVRGDEYFHWYEDVQGFTVVRDAVKQYVYAGLDAAGRLAPTGMRVGSVNPKAAGLSQGVLPARAVLESYRSENLQRVPSMLGGAGGAQLSSPPPPALVQPQGTVKNLVVLCKFADHVFGTHTRPEGDYDTLFNTVGGHATIAPTGSVKDYYAEASYGTMDLASTVVAWVTLPQNESYYSDGKDGTGGVYPKNAQGMIEDALELVDPLVDFGQFDQDSDGFIDSITFIHSGYGAETGGGAGNWIWSHRWSLWALPGGNWTSQDTNGASVPVKVYDYHTEPALWGTSGTEIVRIGVVCHETGHFFGLPDLYDSDYSSRGIGSWCLMANSWGFDGTQLHPPHFSAWCKEFLGWVTPTVITAGTYSAQQVETNPTVYKVTNGFPSGEYLLIENRQPVGFESTIPQGGLAIWHIDTSKASNNAEGYPGQAGWPGNNNHFKVALLQADGLYELERRINSGNAGDLYRSGGVVALTPATVPNTDRYQGGVVASTNNSITGIGASGASMNFTLNGIGGAPIITSASSVMAAPGVPFAYQIVATDLPTSYNATGLPSGLTVNTATGVISGTPSTIGVSTVSLSATNAIGTGTAALTMTIAPILTIADAVDTTGLTWTVGGGSSWTAQTSVSHDGLDAAQSGAIGDSQLCFVETTLTGPGALSFWWKVSSESSYDYLRFTLDGVEQSGISGISGNADWQQHFVSLPAGSHTLRWQYSKDGSVASGADAGWVDQVVFTAGVQPPVITSVMTSSGVLNLAYEYQITATGFPTSYGATGLPAGLIINTATGLISGIPLVSGDFSVDLSATNSAGTGNATLLLSVSSTTLADALDAPGMIWTVGGGAGWHPQTAINHDGQDAGQSGLISDNQESWMESSVSGPGELSFWWMVSSEGSYDYLRFTVDGVVPSGITGISGTVGWQQKTLNLDPGPHVLRWGYSKDSSVSSGSDAGWVDQVNFVPAPPGPEIVVEQPAGSGLSDGTSTVSFGGVVSGLNSSRTFTIRNIGTVDLAGLVVAIDGGSAGDFSVTTSPAALVPAGGETTFAVQFTPSILGGRTANLHIASNDANENPFDIALSGSGIAQATGETLRILTLAATGSAVVDHNTLTGDDRGGIAVSNSHVFVAGDAATSAHSIADLSGGFSVGGRRDGICSDVGSGQVYTLAFDGTPLVSGNSAINQLIELDGTSGAFTGNIITLSSTISLFGGAGVFSGSGRVLIYNGASVYDVEVPSGTVSDRGNMTITDLRASETWAAWGVAEFFGGELYLAYRSSSGNSIVRRRVPDGQLTTIATFTDLGDMASWTISPTNNRWYFHHENSSQFGGTAETLGYADATIELGPPVTAPVITSPLAISVTTGEAFSYQITATLSPTSFDATGLPLGLSVNTVSGTISGTVASAGVYPITLSATNVIGTTTAGLTLTVQNIPTSLADDFDPVIDAPKWSAFGGTVAADTIGQAAGAGSTGNSLRFDGSGSRFATTIPLNTSAGNVLVSFKIALASGTTSGWETADSGEDVVLEYSNDGVVFTQFGGPYTNRAWLPMVENVPPAAQTGSTRFRWRQISNSGANFDNWAIEDVQISGVVTGPEIVVEQPVGVSLTDGVSTVSFGSVAGLVSRTFTISNTGEADLTGLGITIDGANAANFTITTNPTAPVGPTASTTFTVQFSPAGLGSRSAVLHIGSNDLDENPFDIDLIGQGVTAGQVFESWFPPEVTDHGPLSTPFSDGVPSLLKYAFNMAAGGADVRVLAGGTGTGGLPLINREPSGPANVFRFEYLRRPGSGLVYTAQKSNSLAPNSWIPLTDTPDVMVMPNGWERVIYEEPLDSLLEATCFGRVRVTMP